MSDRLTLRCYCCGEMIEGSIALLSMSKGEVDRVFVAKPEHLENFDESLLHSLIVAPLTAP